MNYRWSFPTHDLELVKRLTHEIGISSLLVKCLLNRGQAESSLITTFLEPRLRHLSDPFLLPDMAEAVERLYQAKEKGEPVVIFGDYDVDGVTSTALLSEVLDSLGWTARCYLPHRLEEGYGLNQESVEKCLKKFPTTLLLAADCGSTSLETIEWLKGRGVDVIVLDHHQVSSPLPPARALVNPQLGSSFRELCSAGLAFKLAHALVKRGREAGHEKALQYDVRGLLDLVALGTVADLVPLNGENRILVSAGIERLNMTQRPGLQALRSVAEIKQKIGVFEIGFQLGPRLNAAGRLENATKALDLLRARSRSEAEPIARELDLQNRERQQIERGIVEEVLSLIRAKFNPEQDYVIVEGKLPWHVGVVGIVASRVLREFHRPTIIVGSDGIEWRGSGRSIDGFDLAAALRSCEDLLVRHGGHAMAAGLTILPDRLDLLRTRLNELGKSLIKAEYLRPALRIDSEVTLSELSVHMLKELGRLEPFGQSNPAIHLVARGVKLHRPPQKLGKEQQHLKLWITDGESVHEAVWWNCAEKATPDGTFDLAFVPTINEFNGRQMVQLKVIDWR